MKRRIFNPNSAFKNCCQIDKIVKSKNWWKYIKTVKMPKKSKILLIQVRASHCSQMIKRFFGPIGFRQLSLLTLRRFAFAFLATYVIVFDFVLVAHDPNDVERSKVRLVVRVELNVLDILHHRKSAVASWHSLSPFNLQLNQSISEFDQKKATSMIFSYEIPSSVQWQMDHQRLVCGNIHQFIQISTSPFV